MEEKLELLAFMVLILDFIVHIKHIYKYIKKHIFSNTANDYKDRWLHNVRLFDFKYGKMVVTFFGITLTLSSFMLFGCGSALIVLEYYLGASTLKLLFIGACFSIETIIFYWMAPPIPKFKIRLEFIVP